MSATLPSKLSERHRYIAWLELGGATNNEIADALGFTPSWVSTVRSSPLYKALLAEMRTRATDESIENVKQRIMSEAMNSVGVLIALRDGAMESATRRGAANDLLDRTPGLSKIHETKTDDTLRIIFEGAELRDLANAVAENEGRELTGVIDGVAAALPSGPEKVRVRTVDEYIAEYESEDR